MPRRRSAGGQAATRDEWLNGDPCKIVEKGVFEMPAALVAWLPGLGSGAGAWLLDELRTLAEDKETEWTAILRGV